MAILTLTEIVGEPRTWEGKQGGKFDSYKVRADDNTVYEINVKAGNPPPKLGADEFDITPPKEGTSFPPKIKRQFSGGGARSNAAKDAYWENKEQRDIEGIARMGRAHAQEIAIRFMEYAQRTNTHPADMLASQGIDAPDNTLGVFKALTDLFQADVDASAPTSAPPQRSVEPAGGESKGRESSTAPFASTTQKAEFRRLLKDAGGSDDTVAAIMMYAEAELEPTEISDALMVLKSGNARASAKSLAESANEWATKDFAPDVSGLPEVAA